MDTQDRRYDIPLGDNIFPSNNSKVHDQGKSLVKVMSFD